MIISDCRDKKLEKVTILEIAHIAKANEGKSLLVLTVPIPYQAENQYKIFTLLRSIPRKFYEDLYNLHQTLFKCHKKAWK